MPSSVTGFALAAALAGVATVAAAQAPSPAAAIAAVIKPLLLPAGADYSFGDWKMVEAARDITWGDGPLMLSKASPDGAFFARPGRATVAGRPVAVVAAGARTMVMSVYIRDTAPPQGGDAAAAGFRQAGYGVSPARCAIDPAALASRAWFKLTVAGKRPAFLYVGPLASGGQGYTLYLEDKLPPMTEREAAAYTDDCSGSPTVGGAAPRRPGTGTEGVTTLIEALLRPASEPGALAWPALAALPAVAWKALPPMRMSNPYGTGGDDANPRLLEGTLKTPTTEMQAIATGDDRAASRFLLLNGGHIPRGAVFAALARDGYTLTAVRCGKPYTQMSETWFSITGNGKRPAILYRSMSDDGGVLTESYGLRLDNALPPLKPGQRAAAGAGCPG